MARKSRKKQNLEQVMADGLNLVVQEEQSVLQQIPTAAYVRLSSENSGHDTDDTLQSQITLVRDYIRKQPELKLVDTYVDNGYTGTNFNRPEFERLMQDVRSWKIQCIVVKDLSRFGRDYLETGYYLETIFPKLNVRFIAINDDFDSTRPEDMESLAVPIKNMVNSLYAKDISKKLVTVYDVKRKRGDLPNGFPPYGYVLDEERQTYVIDETTAGYIRAIYQWMLMGVSKPEICRRLEFLDAPRPRDSHATNKKDENEEKGYKWHTSTISRFLQNPIFAGDIACGKTKSAMYKGLKRTDVDREEWVVHRNRHEAVVLRSDFDAVQELFRENKAKYTEQRSQTVVEEEGENPFRGIIYCGCCRGRMTYAKRRHSDEKQAYGVFICHTRRWAMPCGNHTVQENLVKILVMDQIHLLIKSSCERKKMIQDLLEASNDGGAIRSLEKKIASLSFQIKQLEERISSLYMDYADGILDKEEYQYMKEHYISEKQETELRISELSGKKSTIEKKAKACIERSEHLEQYLDCRDYDEALVKELVEAIYIGIDNTIEVRFKCTDVYQELLQCLEEAKYEGQ